MKLTSKQQETFSKIIDRWKENNEGTRINKSNSRQIHNLQRMGIVEIYPCFSTIDKYYNPWEAFPAKELR